MPSSLSNSPISYSHPPQPTHSRNGSASTQPRKESTSKQSKHSIQSKSSSRTTRPRAIPIRNSIGQWYYPPQSYEDAVNRPEAEIWMANIADVAKELTREGVWTPVDNLPRGTPTLSTDWSYRHTVNEDGGFTDWYVTISAKGGDESSSLHAPHDVHASSAHYRSLRVLLALAAQNDYEMRHVVLGGMFNYPPLESEVYVSYPPGIAQGSAALRLNRSIPGVRGHNYRLWSVLHETLSNIGFAAVPADAGLYLKRNRSGASEVIILTYRDHLLIIAPHQTPLNAVLASLQDQLEVEEIEEPTHFLGLRIERDRESRQIWLNQPGYIDRLCARFPEHAKVPNTSGVPVPSTFAIPGNPKKPADEVDFQTLVGCLKWIAVNTRPDISLQVSRLSAVAKGHSPPTIQDFQRALLLLSYLQVTRNLALSYGGKYPRCPSTLFGVSAYSDGRAEPRGDMQCGYKFSFRTAGLVCLAHSPIDWWSRRVPHSAAGSSTDAQLLATTEASAAVRRFHSLLSDLGLSRYNGTPEVPSLLWCENEPAVNLISDTAWLASRPSTIRQAVTAYGNNLADLCMRPRVAIPIEADMPRPNTQLARLLSQTVWPKELHQLYTAFIGLVERPDPEVRRHLS